MLGVTVVGDFINCLRPNVLQNFSYYLFRMILYLRLLLCSYFLLLMLNHSDISLFPDPLEYAIFCLTCFTILNCLTIFPETLFDLEVYKRSQL